MNKDIKTQHESADKEHKEELVRFGISMEQKLLRRFDQAIRDKHYANRSEAVRDLIRDFLIRDYVEYRQSTPADAEKQIAATLTLLYDHHMYDLNSRLVTLQHEHHDIILSTMHLHLDRRHCLEVLVLKGPAGNIHEIANQIIGTRGVLHGKLITTVFNPDCY